MGLVKCRMGPKEEERSETVRISVVYGLWRDWTMVE